MPYKHSSIALFSTIPQFFTSFLLFVLAQDSFAAGASFNSRGNAYLACERCQKPIIEAATGEPTEGTNCSIQYGSIRALEGEAKANALNTLAGLSGAYFCWSASGSYKYFYYGSGNGCESDDQGRCNPPEPDPDDCPTTGNPIQTLSGIKIETVSDYTHPKNERLSMVRTFSSAVGNEHFAGIKGYGAWLFSFQSKLSFTNESYADVYRSDGSIIETFRAKATAGGIPVPYTNQDNSVLIDDSKSIVTINGETVSNPIIVSYRQKQGGGLLSQYNETYVNGRLIHYKLLGSPEELFFSYAADLVTVTDENGQNIQYKLNENDQITDFWGADGSHFSYTYTGDNLTRVTYPDSTYVTYHYEDSRFPTLLTGVTDQKGVRYATWAYDSKGRGISSEHAGGTDKYTLDYTHVDDPSDPRVIETNPLGKQTVYHFTWKDGRRLLTNVEGLATGNCVASNSTYTYDENGFLDLVTDHEGNVTDFDHDDAGREVKQVEAQGAAIQRTKRTLWVTFTIDGASVDKPAIVTEETRVTEYIYDDKGNLTNKIIKPISGSQ